MIVFVTLFPGLCLLWEAVKSGVWQFVRYFGPTDVVILFSPTIMPPVKSSRVPFQTKWPSCPSPEGVRGHCLTLVAR